MTKLLIIFYLSCILLVVATAAELNPVSEKPAPVIAAVEDAGSYIGSITEKERTGEDCGVTENRGLNRLIKEARYLLPVDLLKKIILNAAANDPEVSALRTLLRSAEFRAKVDSLRALSEYRALQDFTCQKLHLNANNYIEFIRKFLNLNLDEKLDEPIKNSRPGVRGLIQDLRDALPRQQLRNLYQRLYAADKDLSTAVRRIRSSEFRQLLRNYRNNEKYRNIFATLEKAGVPTRAIRELVATALGWGNNVDTAAETTIIDV